jgi:hypothetical protein
MEKPRPNEFPLLSEDIPLLDEDWDRMDIDQHELGGSYDLATTMDQEI